MEKIKQLISNDNPLAAIRLLEEYIEKNESDDKAWFLLGKAHHKLGNIRIAINCYLKAIEINPNSPAQEAYNMTIRILDFYNKDMFNQ